MSELKIYTASAGSGKTFQLTRHYLDLLFREPDNYKKILAVTFTNKAAGELKDRVIRELVTISSNNPGTSGHFKYLTELLKKDEDMLQKRARNILRKILQDYGHFSIGTIDHFFQQVLRSFSKEVGIHSGFSLELNSSIFLNGSIDLMMGDLDKDPGLLNWLGKWVDYKINNDESWSRVEKDLKTIGYEFLKEELMEVMGDDGQVGNDKYSEESISKFDSLINGIEKSFEKELKTIVSSTRDVLDRLDLKTGDFKGAGRSPVAFLLALSPEILQTRGRHKNAIDNSEDWYRKDLPPQTRDRVITAWAEGLNDLLRQTNDFLDQNEPVYQSAVLIRQYLFSLGLTGKLLKYINSFSDKSNSLLINLTAPLLSRIIGDNPSPFIYEKVGTYYDHFMIDEFQDTSNLQWANFLPLIRNSLSEDDFSMVVGDVKQSIFRWRNSNWKLMAETAEKDLENFGVDKSPLDKNWRSRESIIDFNNDLFSLAPPKLVEKNRQELDSYNGHSNLDPELLSKIYANAHQEKGDSKPGGYVEVNFQEEANTETETENWDMKIPQLIEDLQIKFGYRPEDIVFLVRTNKQVRSIVNLLQAYRENHPDKDGCSYNIVSSQSYQLRNSAAIRCIIWAIRYIIEPEDSYFQARLAQEFISLKKKQPADSDFLNMMNLSRDQEVFNKLLPEELQQNRLLYRYASCIRVIEEIIRILQLQKDSREMPYLMAFRDQVISGIGTKDKLEDLSGWWDDQGMEVTVPMTEQTGSMRVMTIHKAKGLEFKTVILPYCDWEMGGGSLNQLIWVDTEGTVFDQVPLVPVKFVKKLALSSFSSMYFEEKIQIYLDNLNLLYVAFTRAEDRLYAFCPYKSKRGSYTVSELLKDVLYSDRSTFSKYSFGNPDTYPSYGKKPKGPQIVDLIPYQPEPFSGITGLRQVYDSEPIHHGRIMHEILERTETLPDLDLAINEMLEKGELSREEAGVVLAHLTRLLNRIDLVDWFNGKYVIYRERSILVPGKGEIRPDRLMEDENELIILDYKFGEPRESHGKQVRGYKLALEKMGYKQVRAYLLYPESGQLQEIA